MGAPSWDETTEVKASSAPSWDETTPDFSWGKLVTDIPSEIGNEVSGGAADVKALGNIGEMGSKEQFFDPQGSLDKLMAVPKAVLGAGRVAGSWLTGPAKSVVGHGMANLEHLAGSYINPEVAAKDDPEKMYETAKGDVDTALSAARPAGAPIKVPGTSVTTPHPTVPGASVTTSQKPVYDWQAPSAAPNAKLAPVKYEPSTTSELFDAADNNYANMRGYGVEVDKRGTSNLASEIISDLENSHGYDDFVVPKTYKAIEKFEKFKGQNATISDIENVRKTLNKVAKDPAERHSARVAIEHIDDYLSDLHNTNDAVINPHFAQRVAEEAQTARGNYAAAKRSELIDDAIDRAERQAAAAGSGGNINNAIRQQLKSLRNNDKKMRGWTEDEKKALDGVINGGSIANLGRRAGKFAPEGIVSTAGSVALGAAAGHPALLPAAGYVGKMIGDKATQKAAENLSRLVRGRSPEGKKAAINAAAQSAFATPRPALLPASVAAVLPSSRYPAINIRPLTGPIPSAAQGNQDKGIGRGNAQPDQGAGNKAHGGSIMRAGGGSVQRAIRASKGYAEGGSPELSDDDQAAMMPETFANPYLKQTLASSLQASPPRDENVRFRTASPLVNISDEDIDRGVNIGMASGPGSIKGVGSRALAGIGDMTSPTPEMVDAYKLGQRMREAKQNWSASKSPTGSFDHDLAYGHIKGVSEAEADRAAHFNPVLSGFHESGLQDLRMPTYTRGSRFGPAPKEGRSWNYRENEYEPGVSMARVDHPDFKDYEWADMGGNRQRPPSDYEGWLLPMKGTDDEPLMVGLKPSAPFPEANSATAGIGPAPGIRAYHGSPHDFDKFDLSKIGTGEGAQAYGHGLYFADSEGVAKSYRDALSKQVNVSGSQLGSHPHDSPLATAQHSIVSDVANGIDPAESIATQAAKWREAAEPYRKFALENPEHADAAHQQANSFEEVARSVEKQNPADYVKNPGYMYEVNINADPSHFLDWDKPLSQQPEVMQRLVGNAKHPEDWVPNPEVTGAKYWADTQGGPSDRTGFMNERGIPGIKYLDQGSRTAGQGSSNYVVFNHDLIDIVRKYALAGIALPPAIAAAYEQMQQNGRASGGAVSRAVRAAKGYETGGAPGEDPKMAGIGIRPVDPDVDWSQMNKPFGRLVKPDEDVPFSTRFGDTVQEGLSSAGMNPYTARDLREGVGGLLDWTGIPNAADTIDAERRGDKIGVIKGMAGMIPGVGKAGKALEESTGVLAGAIGRTAEEPPLSSIIKRGEPIMPRRPAPSDEELAAARADTRVGNAVVGDRLDTIVPEHERVAGGSYTPGAPNGGRWSDLPEETLSQPGAGFRVTDDQLKQAWDQSVAESSQAAKKAVEESGAQPKFASSDWDQAMKLPYRDQLWYELSGERMAENLPELSPTNYMKLMDLIGATSARAEPGENLERALAVLSQQMRKKPVDVDLTIPSTVRQALSRNSNETSALPGNKTGHFSDTLALTGGVPTRFPISVNDVWVGKMFGVSDKEMTANQSLHEPMAKYFNKIRDLYNETHGAETPFTYQSWNFQAPAWVHLRNQEAGATSGDAYHQVWGNLIDKLKAAGVKGIEGDKITNQALMDPKFADALRRTTPAWRDAPKATVEFGTTQSNVGKSAHDLYQKAIESGDTKSQQEYLQGLTSAMHHSARGEHPWDALKKAVTGDVTKGNDITRIAHPGSEAPLDVGGTFEGAVSPNIRVPLKGMSEDQINYFNAVAGKHLKQDAMAASEVRAAEQGSEPAEGYIRGHSAFVPTTDQIQPEHIRDFAKELATAGHDMSYVRYPNGYQFDVLPNFAGDMPKGVTPEALGEAYAKTMEPHYGEPIVSAHDFKSVYTPSTDYGPLRSKLMKEMSNDFVKQATAAGTTKDVVRKVLQDPSLSGSLTGRAKKAWDTYRARLDHLANAEKGFKGLAEHVSNAHSNFITKAQARAEKAMKKAPKTPGAFRLGGAVMRAIVASRDGP